MLAKEAGKPFATLRCNNVGFPPPEKYRPHDKLVGTGKYKIVKRKGKRYRKEIMETVFVIPMRIANSRGIWWCPYCREMRRFILVDGFRHEGVWSEGKQYECPICAIPHRDFHVRRWNPEASKAYSTSFKRTRRGKSTKRKGRSK